MLVEFVVIGHGNIQNRDCILAYEEQRDKFSIMYLPETEDIFNYEIFDRIITNVIVNKPQIYLTKAPPTRIGKLDSVKTKDFLRNYSKTVHIFFMPYNKDILSLIILDKINNIEINKEAYYIDFVSKGKTIYCKLKDRKVIDFLDTETKKQDRKNQLLEYMNRKETLNSAIIFKNIKPRGYEILSIHAI